MVCCPHPAAGPSLQAYEGLETAKKLRQEYLFIPAKVGGAGKHNPRQAQHASARHGTASAEEQKLTHLLQPALPPQYLLLTVWSQLISCLPTLLCTSPPLPACCVSPQVKEVYLAFLLEQLAELKCRSAIVFVGTCKVGWAAAGEGRGACLRGYVPRLSFLGRAREALAWVFARQVLHPQLRPTLPSLHTSLLPLAILVSAGLPPAVGGS